MLKLCQSLVRPITLEYCVYTTGNGDLTCEMILICWKRYEKEPRTRLMIKDRNLSYSERLKILNITYYIRNKKA